MNDLLFQYENRGEGCDDRRYIIGMARKISKAFGVKMNEENTWLHP
jgi:hypothetical protein